MSRASPAAATSPADADPAAPGAPAILLMGPTASGKSDWAMALAEREPIEIVSVDSAQVYRGLDLGTAKPSAAARARVPHHLIDIRDLVQSYSAGDFAVDARRLIGDIRQRGARPVLVGGTGLYFRALVHGLAPLPRAQPQIRLQLDAEAAQLGWPAMHARLAAVDPTAAAQMRPSDSQRIQRALEVWLISGRRISDWHASFASAGGATDLGPLQRWALVPSDRERLHARIAARLDSMLAAGWVQEVERLHARPDLSSSLPALRAVGYRQLWRHVAGEIDLATAVSAALAATRQLAKRQMTWIRGDPEWRTLDPFGPGARDDWLAAVTERPTTRG
jgi:tRNA dimethylallyltransferase